MCKLQQPVSSWQKQLPFLLVQCRRRSPSQFHGALHHALLLTVHQQELKTPPDKYREVSLIHSKAASKKNSITNKNVMHQLMYCKVHSTLNNLIIIIIISSLNGTVTHDNRTGFTVKVQSTERTTSCHAGEIALQHLNYSCTLQ